MALEQLEKLHTSAVILPSGDFSVDISPKELQEVVRQPEMQSIPPINAVRITSLRDQVVIDVGQGRILIRDDSDDKPGTARFTSIVHDFAMLLSKPADVHYRALGWNYDVSFVSNEEALPAEVIAGYIDRVRLRERTGLDVNRGAIRLYYEKDGKRCTFHLEPLGNEHAASRFFAHMNVHSSLSNELPEQTAMEASFLGEYDAFISLVSDLVEQ